MMERQPWTQAAEDGLVRAVLQDRARRWGYNKSLSRDELDRWVSIQEHSKNVRADVRAMLAALERDWHEWALPTLESATNAQHGCGRIRLDHAAAPFGPYCLLEADHVGPCEWPYPFDHAHENGKCVAPPR